MRSMSGKGKESHSSTAHLRHIHAHTQQVNQCKSDHAVVCVWISLSQPQCACLMGCDCAGRFILVVNFTEGHLASWLNLVHGTRVVDLSKTWMVFDQFDCHTKNKWLQVSTCPPGFAEAGRRGNKVKAATAGQPIPHHPSLRSCSHLWPVTQRKACRMWWTDAALSKASELDWVRGRLGLEIIY